MDQSLSDSASDNEIDCSSELSEDSFHSATDYIPYEEDLEPIPNEEEAEAYSLEKDREDEEEQTLLSRFSGEEDVADWCKCSNCSLEFVVKHDECRCCMEVDRCREKMEESDMYDECITDHVAFENVCLDTWVLEVAGIGLKTKARKSYNAVLGRENPANSEYFRSIAYRQFVRLVWEYIGAGKRVPLPCCVYNKIREKFRDTDDIYTGYEEDDEEDDEEEEDDDVDMSDDN
ncbi:hypothetical protein QZH41_020360 [Actinostola sp. cb2023]|nr:hypothetical protein QZH41_020360 [Actinostola sp. cb2023]